MVACEHLNYAAGPNEVYHLAVTPADPDFAVTLGLDRVDAPAGGVGLLPVTGVARLNGFAGAVELTVVGDDLSGSLTVPAAVTPSAAAPADKFDGEITLAAVSVPAGVTAKFKPVAKGKGDGEVELSAGPMAAGPGVVVVRGTAKVDGKDVTVVALPAALAVTEAKKK